MTRRQKTALAMLGLAIFICLVCIAFVLVGYIPANRFSHNPHHELIVGLLAGAAAGISIGVGVMSYEGD
jgi:RsiW-degrading membrane proteinase PrsW (M82 family)